MTDDQNGSFLGAAVPPAKTFYSYNFHRFLMTKCMLLFKLILLNVFETSLIISKKNSLPLPLSICIYSQALKPHIISIHRLISLCGVYIIISHTDQIVLITVFPAFGGYNYYIPSVIWLSVCSHFFLESSHTLALSDDFFSEINFVPEYVNIQI